MSVFRDKTLQSEKDNEQLRKLAEYVESSPGDLLAKFDNFPKYVQKNALTKFLARYEIYKLQLDVPGSIVELGVARGASLMTWAQLSAIYEPVNYSREVIGFDTFEGFPSIHKNDQKEFSSHYVQNGGISVEEGMLEDIQRAVSAFDTNRPLNHIEKVKVIKGDIRETLPEFLKENSHLVVSLLHLDVDLYEPTKLALELLVPKIPKGGIILFDELNIKLFPGETTALIETLGISSLKLKRFPWATTLSYAIIE